MSFSCSTISRLHRLSHGPGSLPQTGDFPRLVLRQPARLDGSRDLRPGLRPDWLRAPAPSALRVKERSHALDVEVRILGKQLRDRAEPLGVDLDRRPHGRYVPSPELSATSKARATTRR